MSQQKKSNHKHNQCDDIPTITVCAPKQGPICVQKIAEPVCIKGIKNPIEVTGPVCVKGEVSVTGPIEVTGPVCVKGEVSVTGPIEVTGPVCVKGEVSVTGSIEVTGPVCVKGEVSVTGPIEVTGPVCVKGEVSVTGPVLVSGGVAVTGLVGVIGPVEVTGPVCVKGEVSVTGPIEVTGQLCVISEQKLLATQPLLYSTNYVIDPINEPGKNLLENFIFAPSQKIICLTQLSQTFCIQSNVEICNIFNEIKLSFILGQNEQGEPLFVFNDINLNQWPGQIEVIIKYEDSGTNCYLLRLILNLKHLYEYICGQTIVYGVIIDDSNFYIKRPLPPLIVTAYQRDRQVDC